MASYTNATCLTVIEGVKKEQIVKDLKKHAANQKNMYTANHMSTESPMEGINFCFLSWGKVYEDIYYSSRSSEASGCRDSVRSSSSILCR